MTFTSGPWAPTKPHSRRIWFVQAATTIRFSTVSVRSCHTVSTFSMRHFRSKRAAMCANLRRRRWFSEGALPTRQLSEQQTRKIPFRCRHRPSALDLPHGGARRRARRRDLGEGFLDGSRQCQRLGADERYQLVHHGLWDYDTPAAPNLIDITVGGKAIKAVAQVTKQAFVYVFDRVTGEPVWPIKEQPVPASNVPGERASKTQPFPTKPAPIDIQGLRDEDLIDLTPELRKEAIDIVAEYDRGPLFTPPSQRGTIQVPGVGGGGNWAGAAIDPETGMFYFGTYPVPFVVNLLKPGAGESSYDFIGEFRYLSGPRGLPLLKPPFGSIVAIDMNTGDHRWRIPVGRGELLPVFQRLGVRERLGFLARSWALVTKTVLIVVQSGYFGAPRLPPGG